jgi:GT2 family glycosyltransferase
MQGHPELARQLHNEAIALARAARGREACVRLREAVATTGEADADPRTLKALWQIARAEGDWNTALAAGIRASVRDPLDFAFTAKLVASLDECPLAALVPEQTYRPMAMPADLPTLSVIVVSRDDRRYADVNAQFEVAFGNWAHERIRIRDATSMYDGYARGFAKSSGQLVVFSHDDIRFGVPDFAARLAETMSEADVAGVAGTTQVAGPALHWAGHPHLHGAITHKAPADVSYELALMSLHGPRIERAQALDGVFIAARREWVERVAFDTAGIPGFHLYDLDFSYRAHLAGARLAIACDLALIHQSRGNLDAAWTAARAAFAAKFPGLNAQAHRDRHWYHTSLPDEASVLTHYAKLFAAWQLRLS